MLLVVAVNGTATNLANTLRALSANAANNGTGVTNLAYKVAQQVAYTCITSPKASTAIVTNTGWSFHNTTGVYARSTGLDYLLRACKPRFQHNNAHAKLVVRATPLVFTLGSLGWRTSSEHVSLAFSILIASKP